MVDPDKRPPKRPELEVAVKNPPPGFSGLIAGVRGDVDDLPAPKKRKVDYAQPTNK